MTTAYYQRPKIVFLHCMRIMILVLFAICLTGIATKAYCQENEFSNAVKVIMRDAPNDFRNIRGKEKNNSLFAIVWDCGITVPGTIASRFVSSKGVYYEGALVQATDTAIIRSVYKTYIAKLDSFLLPMKYERSDFDNFYPGLSGFPKIAYLPEPADKPKNAPAHLALEVTHSKELNAYTVVLFIYEH